MAGEINKTLAEIHDLLEKELALSLRSNIAAIDDLKKSLQKLNGNRLIFTIGLN